MSWKIPESDWKLLSQFHPVALERFCQRVLLEIEHINSEETKSFHQRCLEIFQVTERQNKEMSQVFNDLRRSTAWIHLLAMQTRGLMTQEEFLRFSHETRSVIESLRGGHR